MSERPKHSFSSRVLSFPVLLLRQRWLWVLALVLVVLWFGHGPLLTWSVRTGLKSLESHGVIIRAEHMDIRLNGPIEIENLQIVINNPELSTTDLRVHSVTLRYGSFWNMFWSHGRVFSALELDGLEGTLDVRPEALPPPPFRLPVLTAEQKERFAYMLLRLMPFDVDATSPAFDILAIGQVYEIRKLALSLRENAAGVVTAGSVYADIFGFKLGRDGLTGVTGWRNGKLTVTGVDVREGIGIRRFTANFVKLGAIGLSWELGLYDGTVRGDLDIGERLGFLHLDGTLSINDLSLEEIPGLLDLPASAAGRISDARLTYRGNPDFPMDSEIALRLSASDFRWNDRGWQSMEIGATYIGRRLYLSNFHLAQESNLISANGEATIPQDLATIPQSKFFLNLSADVRNVEALATLIGPELDEYRGQLALHGSISGNNGDLNGYLNAAANGLQIFGLPPSTAKISSVITTTELQIRHFEFWSGDDHLNAKATIAIQSPHQYSGELSLRIDDIGLYTPLLPAGETPQVYTGRAEVDWQGDGNVNAHSGAFNVRLADVTTEFTPAGISGVFSGTYSPENIYVGLARLTHADLALEGRLTLASSGINVEDLELKRLEKPLLTGEAFLPLDVFAMAQGGGLDDALSLDRAVYVRLKSGTLAVPDLLSMAGQEVDASGTVSLNLTASGKLPELALDGKLEGTSLSATFDNFVFPRTSVALSLATANRRLALSGKIDVDTYQPLTLAVSMPFAFEKTPDGGMRWFDSNAPVEGQLRFPETKMEILRPLLAGAKTLAGTMRGSIDLSGTVSEPRLRGGLSLTGGVIEWAQNLPVLRALEADIQFDASEMTIRHIRGEVGAGPFELTGKVNYANLANPSIQLSLTGENVLLYRDPGFRLRADLALSAEGTVQNGGSLSGSIDLKDGRIYRRLEITPLLVQTRVDDGGIAIPVVAGFVPEPWSKWLLDVRVQNTTPFLIVGNIATGAISPDLTLLGTFGDPTLAGVVRLQNLQAYLPASDLIVPDGVISFTASNPFMPIMDVRGFADVAGIRVQAFAYGPLSNANFAMRSDPPLSQENLILLLTTGVAPVGMSGAGLGVVAAGQGSVLLLRSFARQLEPFGINLGGFVNRFGVSVLPPADTTQGTSVVADFRVTDQFSLTSGTDGFGFFNAGFRYTIRFR